MCRAAGTAVYALAHVPPSVYLVKSFFQEHYEDEWYCPVPGRHYLNPVSMRLSLQPNYSLLF